MTQDHIYEMIDFLSKAGIFLILPPTLLLLLLGASPSLAEETAPRGTVRVGLFIEAPFVVKKTAFSGMGIELWEGIANKFGLDFTYQEFPSPQALLDAASAGDIDVAVAGLAITAGRLERLDFTQPWLDTGLRIMVKQDRGRSAADLLKGLYQAGHLRVYFWIGVIVVLATVFLTCIDRAVDQEFPRNWHEGLVESFYHVMSVLTSGKTSHKQVFGIGGRLLAAIWMICGVSLVAYVTSSITAVMTASSLKDNINGIADIHGKTIGVLKGSAGETYSLDNGIEFVAFDDLAEAVQGLLRGDVSALLNDATSLEYFDRTHPLLPVTEVGSMLRPEMLGFALRRNSPLTRDLSLGILAAREDGQLDRLRQKYLGRP